MRISRRSAHLSAATCMLFLLLPFVGCQVPVAGSGKALVVARPVPTDFSAIHLSTSGDLEVLVGQPSSISITVDDNLVDLIDTEIRNGKLYISSNRNWSSQIGLKIRIGTPRLDSIGISGSGHAKVQDLSGESFSAAISGSGEMSVWGSCQNVNASISGSGSIDLSALQAENGDAQISGSGEIDIHSTNSISANISGSGQINVFGEPKDVQQAVSGSGDVVVKQGVKN